MGRISYVCAKCSEHFTHKTSGKRHNLNLHYGRADIVPLIEYIVGRSQGMYTSIHPSWYNKSAQRLETLNTAKGERVIATVPDSTQGIVNPLYDSNLTSKCIAHESEANPTFPHNDDTLEDISSKQPFPDYTLTQQRSYEYFTLQKSFKCNLLFPVFLPPNTMRDLLELEALLNKYTNLQVVSPQMILQNAIDQCKTGKKGFLINKLNQLRRLDSLKY